MTSYKIYLNFELPRCKALSVLIILPFIMTVMLLWSPDTF